MLQPSSKQRGVDFFLIEDSLSLLLSRNRANYNGAALPQAIAEVHGNKIGGFHEQDASALQGEAVGGHDGHPSQLAKIRERLAACPTLNTGEEFQLWDAGLNLAPWFSTVPYMELMYAHAIVPVG
ncbi:hypothetical protein [Roseomonas sp. 18066]|uniref:hypothetical protein n=1 Tax=Roseomonas sp. 18066 TaxID=2681412 RepID=UPI00135C61AC|nr:hypothetical protein [Roseomonas sp. 18066]